jgi:hypothetical protein
VLKLNVVRKPEGKRQLGKPKRRWDDDIGVDLKEISWEGVDWMHVAKDGDQYRAVVNGESGNEISGTIKGGEFLDELHGAESFLRS